MSVESAVDDTDAPDGTRTRLDVRELPPPEPLAETLERVEEMDPGTVLVQLNDRAPQHLYPKLIDRGYEYETVETADAVVTAIWER
ncbi:MAG: DUF2249 domain-containing protein [Halobacteriaceae archaeon]